MTASVPVLSRLPAILYTLAALACLALGFAGLNGHRTANPLTTTAEERAQEVATATIAVYVSLRAINAALSTAQEIEVGASAIGQASLQPLKVLEPVDDTVERVADALFIVASAAALTTVGLGPVSSLGLVLLGFGLLLRLISSRLQQLSTLSEKAVRYGVMIGVAVPVIFSLGSTVGAWATEATLVSAQADLERVAQQANQLIGNGTVDLSHTPSEPTEEDGWFSSLSTTWNDAADGVRGVFESSRQYLEAASVFVSEADTILHASLTLIGVFVLRMIVLPLFLLWGAFTLLRGGGGRQDT